MAETQTQSHQQATWQPPLYDPPPSTSRDPGTTPSSSPYPPLPALGNGRGVATDDNKAPSFVTNASTIDEERGLLSGHAVSGHQEDPESRAGKPDLAMRGSGNWLQTWRENKRLILVRAPLFRLRPITQAWTNHYNPGVRYRSASPASWSCCSPSWPSSSASRSLPCLSGQSQSVHAHALHSSR